MGTLKKENYSHGINILKILSMLMIVSLHVLGQGGILATAVYGSPKYYTAWFLEIMCYCSVNCFAIATGFLMVGRKVKYRKIVSLWIIIEFYNIVYHLLSNAWSFFDVGLVPVEAFLPIYSNQFWYFTAYFCLFFFIPFFNSFIEKASKRTFYALLLTGFLLLSASNLIFPKDSFGLEDGYSVWWLMYLYFVGAGIKKYDLLCKIPKGIALLGFFLCVGFTFISKFFLPKLTAAIGIGILDSVVSVLNRQIITYVSPFILFSAIFLTVFCVKLNPPKPVCAFAAKLQPLIFQVYIIHVHKAIWRAVLYHRFVSFVSKPLYLFVPYILLTIIVIFAACLLIDFIRSLIFKFLRIDALINFLSDKVNLLFAKVLKSKRLIQFFSSKIGI